MNGLAYRGCNWQFARCSRTPPVVGNGATGYSLMFLRQRQRANKLFQALRDYLRLTCPPVMAEPLWIFLDSYFGVGQTGREMLSCFARAILVSVETRE